MNYYRYLKSRVFPLGLVFTVGSVLQGQTAEEQEIIELSPFAVTGDSSIGYQATETLAGTRLRTDLRDVANAVSVVNKEFLKDTGATSQADLLVYTTNTEVGGVQGNFANTGDGSNLGDNRARTDPQSNTRIRGLAQADNTRNFFLTDIPWDSYIVDRVDIQRGANSILFGVGSPAGIINTDLVDPMFSDMGKVDLQVGSYGSVRANIDVNQEIISDELAIRVAGLYEDTKYQQDPAYEEDERLFAAVRWDPSFLQSKSMRTSITANFEKGDINANRPRILPPIDRISRWWDLGSPTYDVTSLDNVSYDDWVAAGMPGDGWAALRGFFDNGAVNPNFQPWLNLRGGDYFDGPLAVFGDPNSSTQDFMTPGQWLSIPQAGPGGSPAVPFSPWAGIATVNEWANSVFTNAKQAGDAAQAASVEGSRIGAYKRNHLSSTDIFDFYNNLLDGPNKYELEDFESYNAALSQTFFGNMFGYELVYDEQKYERRNSDYLNDNGGYVISVDVAENFFDGSANPNVGRAMAASRGGASSFRETERETLRMTAFAELDFSDILQEESFLERALGRHVFTGVYSDSDYRLNTLSWQRQSAADGYAPGSGVAIDGAARQIASINYLGGSLLGTSPGQDLGLGRINPIRQVQSGTMSIWDWTEVDTSFPMDNLNRYRGIIDYAVPVWNAETGDIDNLYTAGGARKQLTTLESKVLVWQGFLFDGNVVPMFSWREDKQRFYGSGTPTNANSGAIMFEDPEWYIPSGPDDLGGNRRFNSESAQTTSYGLVLHLPQSLEERIGLGVSVFYNNSENFQPDAGRVDPFGDPITSPEGETEDYGFAISALNNRFVFKVNWYETSVKNVTLSSGLSGGDYLIGMGEAWAYMFATRARKAYDDNAPFADFSTDFDPDNPNRFLPYQPRAGQSIDEAYAEFLGAVDAFLANPPAKNLQDAWGYDVEEWAQNPGDWINVTYLNGMAVTGDTNSKGVEFEFAAQITPNWNITFNASKTTATRNNIAQPVADWVDERYEFYSGPAGNVRFWGPWVNDGETLKGKFTREFYGDYSLFRALEGANVPELRKWRFNLITNYTFTDGFMKGFNIGGAYRWQDKVVIGYPVINSEDPLDDSSIPSYDIDNPYYGPTESDIDLWVGYERDLSKSVRWRVQLNVRNAFADNDLIPITAQPDGSPAAYRIKEEMTWYLTNTFSF